MMNLFASDVGCCIDALEYYLTDMEEDLISNHGGGDDRQWNKLNEYKRALNNMKFIGAIYGQE